MRSRSSMCVAGPALLLAVVHTAAAQPRLTMLPPSFPHTGSNAQACNADGSVVAGIVTRPAFTAQPFRWTASGGMQLLGYPEVPNLTFMRVGGVNHSGAFVAVSATSVEVGNRAFRWSPSTGYMSIGLGNASVRGINADGSVMTGATGPFPPTSSQVFRWANGGVQLLGRLPSHVHASGNAVSDDGAVVVGSSFAGGDHHAFRWTQALGMLDLGSLNAPTNRIDATSVNHDGSVIVGTESDAGATYVFRWTLQNGLQEIGIGQTPYGEFGPQVSSDGNTVVWTGFSSGVKLWHAALGNIDVRDLLTSYGLDLSGWTDLIANDLSADATAIVGFGQFQGQTRAFLISGLPTCTPTISIRPADSFVCANGSATLTANSLGLGTLIHQWRWRSNGAITWVPLTDGINLDPITNTPAFSAENAATSRVSLSQIRAGVPLEFQCTVQSTCSGTSVEGAIATIASCRPDVNCDGHISSQDFFDFITAFFAQHPSADFNADTFVNSQDFFDFLAALFAGC